MQFVVIKSKFLEEAEIRWGRNVVDNVLELLSKNPPEIILQNLSELKDTKSHDCLLYILQNKFGKN